ncbi:hypothetical protein J3F84DRAFT_382649 [Trichoderma pleuroticola]
MEHSMDDELPVFNFGLSDSTNDSSNFHFENDPADPYERTNVIERRGLIHVRCNVRDIVHGQWGEDSDVEATLLILLFRFDPDDLGRRVKIARIKLSFLGSSTDRPDPEVVRIWPNESYAILPTKRTETVCVGGKGSVTAGFAGFEVGAELSREKSVERELQSMGIVRGSADTEGRNFGLHNSASWTLMENPNTKNGVAASMQCAILLKRRALEEQFTATVQVTVHADRPTAAKEWIRGVFSQPSKVDPIIFDPKRQPTNQLRIYDDQARARLGSINLNDRSLTDITLRNIWEGAEKHT